MNFEATCGRHYFIRMGGRALATGTGTLNVTCAGTCPPVCPADLDQDGIIGFADLVVLLSNWGVCVACPADFDGDGVVGFIDLLVVLSGWGPCPDVEGL